jgi:hypothetical protein
VVEGREWIEALPASLERQAALPSRLLDLAEADRRFRAFEIQCSIARGARDELSDLDVGYLLADDGFRSRRGAAGRPRRARTDGRPARVAAARVPVLDFSGIRGPTDVRLDQPGLTLTCRATTLAVIENQSMWVMDRR